MLVLIGLCGIAVCLVARILYTAYLHPLSHYPGPLLWRTSRLPWLLSTLRGRIQQDLLALHTHYGPVVRIAPDELSFVSARAYHDIYARRRRPGTSGEKSTTTTTTTTTTAYPFAKDPGFYKPAPNGAHYLSSAPASEHLRIRQALSRAFSEKAVREQLQPGVRAQTANLLAALSRHGAAQGEGETAAAAVVDLNAYLSYFAFDVLGELGFGETFDTVGAPAWRDLVDLLFTLPKAGVMYGAVSMVPPLLPFLYFLVPRGTMQGFQRLWGLCREKVRQRVVKEKGEGPKDIMAHILPGGSANPAKAPQMSVAEIEANGFLLMFAGAETTGSALSAAVSYLLRNPRNMAVLQRELRKSFSTIEDISFSSTAQLPYLNAVLHESLRLAPPVAGTLPRVIPEGGDVVCDRHVPANTIVGVPLFAAHRFSENYSFPDKFLPERWLERWPEPGGKGQSEVFQPFSLGPRNCAGMSLAWAEMRLALASLLWAFDISPAPGEPVHVWETQKTYSTWERKPLNAQVKKVL